MADEPTSRAVLPRLGSNGKELDELITLARCKQATMALMQAIKHHMETAQKQLQQIEHIQEAMKKEGKMAVVTARHVMEVFTPWQAVFNDSLSRAKSPRGEFFSDAADDSSPELNIEAVARANFDAVVKSDYRRFHWAPSTEDDLLDEIGRQISFPGDMSSMEQSASESVMAFFEKRNPLITRQDALKQADLFAQEFGHSDFRKHHGSNPNMQKFTQVDWELVSRSSVFSKLRVQPSPAEIRSHFLHSLRPSYDKTKWSKEEEELLESIVESEPQLPWTTIAAKHTKARAPHRATGLVVRSPVECLQAMARQQKAKHSIPALIVPERGRTYPSRGVAPPTAVNSDGKNYIPWNMYLDKRLVLAAKAYCTLPDERNPRLTSSAVETAMDAGTGVVASAIDLPRRRGRPPASDGGINWVLVQSHVPQKTDVQCRERFKNSWDPKLDANSLSAGEIKRLKAEVAKLPNKNRIPWAKLARESFPTRTDAQLRRAFTKKQKGAKKKAARKRSRPQKVQVQSRPNDDTESSDDETFEPPRAKRVKIEDSAPTSRLQPFSNTRDHDDTESSDDETFEPPTAKKVKIEDSPTFSVQPLSSMRGHRY